MSSLFSGLLIAHLLGVFVLIGSLSIEIIGLVGVRLASTVQGLRAAVFAVPALKYAMPIATVLVMVPGVWMAFLGQSEWSWSSPWVLTAFVLIVVLAVDGAAHLDRKFNAIWVVATTATDGPVPPALASLATAPSLHYPAWAGLGTILPFLYLMVGHPGWGGSLLAVGLGVAGGLLVGRLLANLSRRQPVTTNVSQSVSID